MNERTQLRKARRYEKLDEDAINKATTALLRNPYCKSLSINDLKRSTPCLLRFEARGIGLRR